MEIDGVCNGSRPVAKGTSTIFGNTTASEQRRAEKLAIFHPSSHESHLQVKHQSIAEVPREFRPVATANGSRGTTVPTDVAVYRG